MKTLLALLVAVAPALADSQAELAAKLNDEGKRLMYDGNYEGAQRKFQDAVARVPDPRYLFNLCTAEFQQGKFGEALVACTEVGKHKPDDTVKAKTDRMIGKIKAEAKAQHIKLN